ncbi:unnamed protein product, partial [Meganyctiphanes norvegica]
MKQHSFISSQTWTNPGADQYILMKIIINNHVIRNVLCPSFLTCSRRLNLNVITSKSVPNRCGPPVALMPSMMLRHGKLGGYWDYRLISYVEVIPAAHCMVRSKHAASGGERCSRCARFAMVPYCFLRKLKKGILGKTRVKSTYEITNFSLNLPTFPHIPEVCNASQPNTQLNLLYQFVHNFSLQTTSNDASNLIECTTKLIQQVLIDSNFIVTHTIDHVQFCTRSLMIRGDGKSSLGKQTEQLKKEILGKVEIRFSLEASDGSSEQILNHAPYELDVQVWAIGVLTYVFLSGVTPFGGDTDQETFVNIIKAEYEFPDEYFEDVSGYAKDFISGLLVKKPSDRMTVDDCLNHPWMSADLSVSFNHRNNIESTSLNYDENYEDNAYNQTFTNENELYPLPETENQDSAYFSDSNNYGSLVIPPLYHCSIPEEQNHQQNNNHPRLTKSKSHHISLQSLTLPTRQNHGYRLSVDMEETLRTLHSNNIHSQQQRAVRRASIDPSYFHEPSQALQDTRQLHKTSRPIEEVVLTRDSDVDSGVSCHDCEESRVEASRLCHSDSYDGDAASVVSWDDYSDLGGRRPSLTNIDAATLNSIAKPWEKLCNGSISRAITQLTVKNVPKKYCDLISNNTEMMSSNSDLRATNCELRSSKTDLRASKSDLRASKADLRASKSDLRSSKSELRASKADLRASRQDLRASKSDLRASRSDLRASKSDLRSSKSDLRASKSDLRASRGDLRGSRIDLRGSRANLTLSRLDLAHETLEDEHSLQREAEDVFRGDFTLPRRRNMDHTALAPFMRGNSLHMSFRMPKKKDMKI